MTRRIQQQTQRLARTDSPHALTVMTRDEVAEKLGISKERVRVIEGSAIRKMRKYLTTIGISPEDLR